MCSCKEWNELEDAFEERWQSQEEKNLLTHGGKQRTDQDGGQQANLERKSAGVRAPKGLGVLPPEKNLRTKSGMVVKNKREKTATEADQRFTKSGRNPLRARDEVLLSEEQCSVHKRRHRRMNRQK